MRSNVRKWILALAAVSAPSSVCGMSALPPQGYCRVLHAERLPAESGGEAAVCAAFEKAIASGAPHVRYDSLELEVLSKAGIAATVLKGGKTLAKLNFSVMDRNLNPTSIERFARSLAAEVAKDHSS